MTVPKFMENLQKKNIMLYTIVAVTDLFPLTNQCPR